MAISVDKCQIVAKYTSSNLRGIANHNSGIYHTQFSFSYMTRYMVEISLTAFEWQYIRVVHSKHFFGHFLLHFSFFFFSSIFSRMRFRMRSKMI